jgi:excisionase family DNA binding protein
VTPTPELLQRIEPFLERIVKALTASAEPPAKKFVTVEVAAELMGLGISTVKRLRSQGKLKAIRNGQQWAYLRESVLEWKP